ncbi:hypothetical protein OAJ94_04315 [Deltaproteobacteria bacterium]|nr:hypothetical protein [Deltaproteobacteria bacterium]
MDGEIGQVVGKGVGGDSWLIQPRHGEKFTITFENSITWNNPNITIDESPRELVLIHRTSNIRITVINRIDVCTRCEKEFARNNTIYSHYFCPGTSVSGPRSIRNPSVSNTTTIPCNNSSPTICSDCKRCESCAKLQKEREEKSKNFVQDDDALDRAMYD